MTGALIQAGDPERCGVPPKPPADPLPGRPYLNAASNWFSPTSVKSSIRIGRHAGIMSPNESRFFDERSEECKPIAAKWRRSR